MKSILEKLNGMPEVIGSMVCADQGLVLAAVLPGVFDQQMLQNTAQLVSEYTVALQQSVGRTQLLDFRYQAGRVVIKCLSCGFLVVLCTPRVNLHLMTIYLNVAVLQLEQGVVEAAVQQKQAELLKAASPAPAEKKEVKPQRRIVALSV